MYKYKFLAIAAALGTSALLFPGCTRHTEEKPVDTKFQVTDSLLNSLLIDTVKQANALSEITLTGSIAPDENKMAKIYPMVSGITENVHVLLGDVVTKGQTLADMRSVEVAGFSKDMISSEADLRNTKRILESTEDMYKSGLASGKDLEQAKSDYKKAVAENKRAGSVMSINQTNSRGYVIKAPISGYIVEKNITSNMQVRADNSQNLFTIADLSSVYILVNIYESDITSVQTGYPVKITTLAYPGKVFSGKIDKVYNMIDPDMKVMRARVKIDNPGNLLKPQMFANVVVSAKSDQDLPVINTRAIVLDNDKNYVVVRDGKAKVHIQPITISKRLEDRAYISAGLKPGDQIIASRQLFLYESLKK
ncbi:efflux RND transporter periplasmic adaptor subunit [Pedobacter cryoconitis]|uniref:Cobalt-zinc-cadmium efflux system membrane fusion protein n=1 Tax=Pedobacter cryoconitis TaxID=188932 RepID=A0A7X0J6R0_9SPHI|nr:efflux RND transporter periplasmic adaptor subunit [Pedobacter cryoconitis]MBB6502138.1 cobalt-zinc-cadmium efflux system membrane fusion protein [Pedobacter cryoconitis]